MSNEDTVRELEKLRAELAALKDTQEQTPAPEPDSPTVNSEATDASAHTTSGIESASGERPNDEAMEQDVKGQLDELAALLENEIRDLPTITCLAVFSIGILMGRLLS